MLATDFDFDLPPELIAQAPLMPRSASRLLRLLPGRLEDRRFDELPALLQPGDLLVLNDTRVIRARLLGSKAGSGGRIEALVERVTGELDALVQLRASKTPRPGTRLLFGPPATAQAGATVTSRAGEFFALRFDQPVADVLQAHGQTPLPPYITHQPDRDDDARYQTVFAREPGAVAAPTAGLHFDEALLARRAQAGIAQAFVTLHVGAGTFQPVRVDDLSAHVMHSERYRVTQATAQAIADTRAAGGVAHAGSQRRRPWRHGDGRQRRNPAVHRARLRLCRGRCADHQLSPAAVHADDAGQRVCRQPADPRCLPARHLPTLPVLQLWRRHADRPRQETFRCLNTNCWPPTARPAPARCG